MKKKCNLIAQLTLCKRIILLFLGGCLFLTACGDDNTAKGQQSKILVMGTSADMPPFEFYKTDQDQTKISGFDVDVARAIANELGYELKVQDMDFSSLIPALQSGRIDFAMASMTPTAERLKNVDFSVPYLVLPVAAISKDLTIHTKEDLSGKKIGAQLGSTHEQFARGLAENDPTIQVIAMNKLGELIQDLSLGRLDVVIMETKTAKTFQEKNQELKVHTFEDQQVKFAIALPKNGSWMTRLNQAIEKLHAQGTIDQIKKIWFTDSDNN